mmetsp:Transcript_7461/g.8539  ORF Transcript_7461/g.8539 Transcript_7461/m.8539 type:complete len:390 (+) Transcript_7461:6-1175(+)
MWNVENVTKNRFPLSSFLTQYRCKLNKKMSKNDEPDHQDPKKNLKIGRKICTCQFVMGAFVLLLGICSNGGRKYVVAKTEAFDYQCDRVYVNVLSSSKDENDAVICCNTSVTDPTFKDIFSYDYALCSTWSKRLPLIKSLTRFPDSWIIPIITLLVRFGLAVIGWMTKKKIPSRSRRSIWTLIKRFLFYVAIMQFRGWVLYIYMNKLERIVLTRIPLLANGSINYDTINNQASCWYSDVLRRTGDCNGQQFDFSDHIVLFFAHLYPLMMFEVIDFFLYPFWSKSNSQYNDKNCKSALETQKTTRMSSMIRFILNKALPILLASFLLYVYVISCVAIFLTSAYFHTIPEVVTGYILSLLVQIPMSIMICNHRFVWVSNFLSIPICREHND